MELWKQIIFPVWGVLVFIILTVSVLMVWRIEAKAKREAPAEHEPELEEPVLTEVRATVADMACGVEVRGAKTVRAVKYFRVCFALEGGKTLTLEIPEDMYEGIEVGQTGKMTLVDGQLYGFEPEE